MADIKILGYTLKEWDHFLDGDCATQAEKALHYLDGKQEQEVIKVLNDPNKGRRDWKSNGFIPRYRNLVKPIVTHSGMLFKDQPPTMVIYDKNSIEPNKQASEFLYEELSKIEFTEFCITLDETTRLLKTTLILTQFDIENKELVHTLLHRGNSAVVLDSNYKNIIGCIYETSDNDTYRIITEEMIYDIKESETEQFVIISEVPNPYGLVPVTPFYDTNLPRCGFWLTPGMDLVNTNEMLNLHLTDTEFALKWAKMPTLFTNCNYSGSGEDRLELTQEWGQKLPVMSANTSKILGGPSRAVILDSNGVDSPFAEYKAPVFDVTAMDNVVNGWLYNIAQDWSVRLEINGQARANSGFQLLVEALPNMELRRERQKMFTMGFKRWYKIVARILNIVYGTNKLPEDAELFVEFQQPVLPVDEKVNEEIWTTKLNEGRASLIDYFMEVKGMTLEESIKKIEEINKYSTIQQKVINTEQQTNL